MLSNEAVKKSHWSKSLNDFFSNIIKTLNIAQTNHSDSNFGSVRGCALKTILQYINHSSILTIKEMTKSVSVFAFNHITTEDVMKEIKDSDVSKLFQVNGIPTKIIKENAYILSNFTYQSFNNMIDVNYKGPKNYKENYRPVTILPKIYERCLFKQMSQRFQSFNVALGKVSVQSIT